MAGNDADTVEDTDAETEVSPDVEPDATEPDDQDHEGKAPAARPRMSPVRLTTIVGLIVVIALAALCGWLGFRAHQSRQLADDRQVYLDVGRDGALALTTFDFDHIDAQVQHTLDLATGKFYDDFQRRAASFSDLVKQVRSKSSGTVSEVGLESQTPTTAKVLVAVTVTSEIAGQPEQQPKYFRMRLSLQKADDGAKVSDVEFVS
jgi:Mce-associated membrane protein